jgi:hypothetical protein
MSDRIKISPCGDSVGPPGPQAGIPRSEIGTGLLDYILPGQIRNITDAGEGGRRGRGEEGRGRTEEGEGRRKEGERKREEGERREEWDGCLFSVRVKCRRIVNSLTGSSLPLIDRERTDARHFPRRSKQ